MDRRLCEERFEKLKDTIAFESEQPPNAPATSRAPHQWYCLLDEASWHRGRARLIAFVRDVRDAWGRAETAEQRPLATSSEVHQELAHAYLSVDRTAALAAALQLVERSGMEVWPLERDDVILGVELAARHPGLGARDLGHLCSCQRRGVTRIETFDRALKAAADSLR